MQSVTGEKTLITYKVCPGWGVEPGPSGQKSDTLPLLHKSRNIQQGHTSVYILSNTTHSPSIFRFILESQFEFQQTYKSDTDVLRAHRMGYLRWAPNVSGEKCFSPMPRLWIEPWSQGPKSDNLPFRHKIRLTQQGCTSVYILSTTTHGGSSGMCM